MSRYVRSWSMVIFEAIMWAIIAVVWGGMFLLLTACQTLPQPPKIVAKVVAEYRPIPDWATAEVPNNPPASQSVKAITESNNRRGETLDYVNCRSRLLAKLGKGEAVSQKECKP